MAPLAPAPVLTFDHVTHTYYHEGQRVSRSVTEVLQDAGMIDFSAVPQDKLMAAQARGSRVHKACHFYTEGLLRWDTVDHEDRPRVEACAQFIETSGFEVGGQERMIYLPDEDVAGTVDLFGWWQGQPALADYKTGRLTDVACDLQTAAYAEGLRRQPPLEWFGFTPHTPIVRIGVELRQDGTFRTQCYADPRDWSHFRLLVQYLNLRQSRRRGVWL